MPAYAGWGPAISGWIFDTFGGYAWLYIGSFAVGLGAAAIALAFPPSADRPALPSLQNRARQLR
jgi:hypothetical protein